jgi:hypothetical protein
MVRYGTRMQTIATPKLVRVYCAVRHTSRGTGYRYTGQFEDGTQRKLRESFTPYVSVAQVNYPFGEHFKEKFVFSAKTTVNLGPWYRRNLVAEIGIGLDTAANK